MYHFNLIIGKSLFYVHSETHLICLKCATIFNILRGVPLKSLSKSHHVYLKINTFAFVKNIKWRLRLQLVVHIQQPKKGRM